MNKNLEPRSFKLLIDQLRKLPGLSSRQVYKIGLQLIEKEEKEVQALCQVLSESNRKIKQCSTCCGITEEENCLICQSERRDQTAICVVENWLDLKVIEESETYSGLFHVLQGLICPLQGVFAFNLTIEKLIKRIQNSPVQEIMFALSSSPEGEVTASFVAAEISKIAPQIKLSRLASGIPLGSKLEYLDKTTLCKAILQRQLF